MLHKDLNFLSVHHGMLMVIAQLQESNVHHKTLKEVGVLLKDSTQLLPLQLLHNNHSEFHLEDGLILWILVKLQLVLKLSEITWLLSLMESTMFVEKISLLPLILILNIFPPQIHLNKE